MCGIAGYLGTRPIEPAVLDGCLKIMHHRGPQAAGRTSHETPDGRRVELLHTRLAIVDLDPRAVQPMSYRGMQIIYNGELYNHRELAKRFGWSDLRTTSDTEVMLRLLYEHGEAGLDAAEGMWSFAIFDERSGTLRLGRDRFGQKPLYTLETDDGVYFGSEIKFIRTLLGQSLEPDQNQILRYLVNGYRSLHKTSGRSSFYRDIREVVPGTTVPIDARGVQPAERYWRFRHDRQEAMSFDEAAENVRAALIRSVELRLRADVPIAFLMSGGVDSNALIAIARRVFDHEVHGFTIVNRDERYAEQELVDLSVRELGVRHESIELDPARFLDRLAAQVVQHDGPVCTISFYIHQRLVEAVAEHDYRIVISGIGADEMLTGYYQHHNAYLHAMADDPERYPSALAEWQQHVAPIVRNPFLSQPDLFITNPACRDYIYFDADAFREYLCDDWSERFGEVKYPTTLLRSRMLNELFHETIPPMLRDEDLNAMSVSIENRAPFLDRGFFDACAAIPDRHLVRDGHAKAVLRAAMRGIVPDPILDSRRKIGFNAPIRDLLDPANPEVRDRVLADGPVYDLLRRDKVEQLLTEDALPNSRSKFLFSILNVQAFLETAAHAECST